MKRKLLYCLLIVAATLAFNTPSVAQSIASGYYFIKSAYTHAAANSCIYDPQTTDYVKIQVSNGEKNAIFWISEFEDGKYTVQNAETGRYLIKFIKGTGVLLANAPEDDVYTQFDPAEGKDGIYHFKDNTQTNYYNWNGAQLNGGAPFHSTYNYHDFTVEAVSADLLEQLGIDGTVPPVAPDPNPNPDPEPDPDPIVTDIAKGYYFIKSAYSGHTNDCIYDPQTTNYVKIHATTQSKAELFWIDQFEDGKYHVKNALTGRYVIKFVKDNGVLLNALPEDGVYTQFDPIAEQKGNYRWKDNKQTNYYNWNGQQLNGGAGLSSTYNYHDFTLEAASAELLTQLGIDANTPPDDAEPEPEPEPMVITDGFYFIRSAYDSPYVGPNVVVYDPAEENCIKNHNNGYEKQDIFLIKQFEEGKYTVQNLATARYINKFEGTNNITLAAAPEEGTWIEFANVRADVFRWKDNHTNAFYNWNGNAINGGAGLSSTYNYHDWQLVPVSKDLLASFGIEGDDIPVITPPVDSVVYIDASWMSLGTSITWYNNNVSSAFTKGYQTRVREELPFKGFINRGVNASCIAGCDGQVGFANYYTIEHGINDWGHSTPVGTLDDYINNTKNGTFAASYRILIDKIYATNPNAMVILCTPRKGYGFGGYLPDNCDEAKNGIYLKDYAEVIRQIAEYESLPVADFFALCGNQRNLAQLSIDQALHPNDPGYQLMADVLIKEFRKILLHPIVNPVAEDDF